MNTGFVNFPTGYPAINQISGRTFIYICAFDTLNAKDKWSKTANIHINQTGTFVSDDVMTRPSIKNTNDNDVDNIVSLETEDKKYDKLYFPHDDKAESVPMQAAICVGWIESAFENKSDYKLWYATFRDLTKSGRELFYQMKKLHYNKEVRILTFSE